MPGATDEMSLLVVQDVSKTYRGQSRPAVEAASFAVGENELVALVGDSGSGKTTLLRLIAGLERPDAGRIALAGRTLSTPHAVEAPERRGLGFVFQHHALFPHLTVERNIGFGLHRKSRVERAATVAAMLDLVGLRGCERRYPHELSGGERQRIALARSLAPAPHLLLLDEPFSSLDVRLRHEVRDLTRAVLKKQGAACVFVTHDVYDALSIADRIVLLRGGRIQQDAPPTVAYHRPANEYVAAFLGACNFLPAGALRDPGLRVAGPPSDAAAPGMWVRPEDLELAPCDGGDRADGDHGGLIGFVETVRFSGNYLEVCLRCKNGGGSDDASFPVHVRLHSSETIQPGDRRAIRARRIE